MGWTVEVVLALIVAGLAVCWLGCIALCLAADRRRDDKRHAEPADDADAEPVSLRLFEPHPRDPG